MTVAGQLSLFGAGVGHVGAADLEGLLCGPGQVAWRPDGARVSVLVAGGWRVQALLAELAARGLAAEAVAPPSLPEPLPGSVPGTHLVRTGFADRLRPLAARWTASSGKRPPPDLRLDGARLRLWCLAAGRPADAHSGPGRAAAWPGWQLALGRADAEAWLAVGAALAAIGLPAAFVGPRVHGPAYRLSGSRRLARLAELVGDPPDGCPADGWPA